MLDPKEKQRLEDVGFMTCMTLTLLGNYAQTGHFGGPLAYTPYNVAVHLAGPNLGGLRHDYRRPKHPYGDKFMLAAGHCAPTCYALWMEPRHVDQTDCDGADALAVVGVVRHVLAHRHPQLRQRLREANELVELRLLPLRAEVGVVEVLAAAGLVDARRLQLRAGAGGDPDVLPG
ncbi:MAG TPA: hypothetical protein VFO48_12375, partial [Vicinamibacterales bacterium]|nr:hypothetical protein [Vicinamibacterales bacterium]